MNQVEAVRRALGELGDVSEEELVTFIKTNYGVLVRPQIVPILKATIKEEEILAEWGRKAQAAKAQANKPSLSEAQLTDFDNQNQ